jgi:hypothetical protein
LIISSRVSKKLKLKETVLEKNGNFQNKGYLRRLENFLELLEKV